MADELDPTAQPEQAEVVEQAASNVEVAMQAEVDRVADAVTALDIADEFSTNVDAELDGVWVKYKGTASEFLIARWNNEAFMACFKREIDNGLTVSDEVDAQSIREWRDVVNNLILDSVLRGWRNVNLNGQPLEFNRENARKLLGRGGKSGSFKDWVYQQAQEIELFNIREEAKQGEI